MFVRKRLWLMGSSLILSLAAMPVLAQTPVASAPGSVAGGQFATRTAPAEQPAGAQGIKQTGNYYGGTVVGQPANWGGTPVVTGHDISGEFGGTSSECGGAGTPCDACCDEDPFWRHRSGVFADWIFLRAGNVDIDYAVPVDGTASSAVPTGPVGVADPEHESGFRVGFDICLDDESSLRATYHFFESSTDDDIVPPSGDVIRALTTHPNTLNAFSDSNAASAEYDIDFQMVDLDYRHLLLGGCNYGVNYLLGVRYANLDQNFRGNYIINGVTTVDTDIDFDGVGPRIGLDGERRLKHGFLVYSRSAANFLVGEFRGDYSQNNIFAGNQATTAFDDDRIVPVLEFEAGLGWESCSGCFSVRAGYYIAGWFNTMTTPSFIDAVQAHDFTEVDETLTFDGLTVRAELKF